MEGYTARKTGPTTGDGGGKDSMGFGGFVFALIKHNVKGKKSRNMENNVRKRLYPFIKISL